MGSNREYNVDALWSCREEGQNPG